MEFIPYQRLTITTDLSTEEVTSRMKESIGANEIFVKVAKNIFNGQLVNNNFILRLNKNYRNSWTPEINGTIRKGDNKTEVTLLLKSNTFVIIFTSIFMLVGLTMTINEIIDFETINDFDWTALLFLIFPYGLCWFGFNLDADKAIDGLLKITKGEIK